MPLTSVDTRRLAPRFILSVENTTLKDDLLRHVTGVMYEEGENVAAKLEVSLADPGFRLMNHRAFAEGNRFDLWLGYAGRKMYFQNRCTVIKPIPRFPESGSPSLTPVAHDATRSLMSGSPIGLRFQKIRDDQIVEEILSSVGIRNGKIRRVGARRNRFLKRGATKWDLIQRITKRHGFSLNIRFNTDKKFNEAFWGPPEEVETQEKKFNFVYGSGEPDATCLSFEPDTSLPSQATKIDVAYVDPVKRRTRRLTVDVDQKAAERTRFVAVDGFQRLKKTFGNGPTVNLTVFGQTEEVVLNRPFRSAKEAKRFVTAWWARREREFSFARAKVLGEGSLRKGQVHKFTLPSERWTGDWLITSLRQNMRTPSNWVSELTLTKVVLGSVVGSAGNPAGVVQKESEQ